MINPKSMTALADKLKQECIINRNMDLNYLILDMCDSANSIAFSYLYIQFDDIGNEGLVSDILNKIIEKLKNIYLLIKNKLKNYIDKFRDAQNKLNNKSKQVLASVPQNIP